MRYFYTCLILISTSIIWGLQTPGQILFKTTNPIEVKGQKTGLDAFDSFLSSKGVLSVKPIKGMPGNQYYSANLSSMPDNQYLNNAIFPGITYMTPNFLRKLHLYPNDQLYNQQLHYVSQIDEAWNYSTGSHLIRVGVIDSGVLMDHPDLQANIYINHNEIPDNGIDDDNNGYIDDWRGWDFADAPELMESALGDFIEQDNDPTDENFHGTHVAGIIGAAGNNSIGIAGVCWNVSIMALRAGFRTTQGLGYLQDDDAAAAIIYAADNGCHVINMSWGDPNYSPIIADACEYAYAKGVVLVASAGNDPGDNLSYPAKLSCVISVGSVNKGKALSGFSSYGVDLDLVAVGERVLSTYKMEADEQYFMQDGTSMSAPYVTGSVALLLTIQPDLTPPEVRAKLLTSTDDLEPPGFDIKTGHGLLNTKRLLDNTNPLYVEVTSPLDQLGISGTVPIIGSVYGADFFRYSVCFSNISDPQVVGWYDVATHANQPEFHYTQVHNGVIAEFYVPPSLPEGRYLIRVQYEKTQSNMLKYNYYRTVTIDRTPPLLRPQSLMGFTRFQGQNLRHYIAAAFNEVVQSELIVTASDNSVHHIYSPTADSIQVWALPADLPQGEISIRLTARNSSDLTFVSNDYPNFLNIVYEYIPSYGFEMHDIGNPRRPIGRMHDFNSNGQAEYMAMELPKSGYGTVKVYEPTPNAHIQTHTYDDAFWPLDIGNTNNTSTGMELLFLRGDTGYLWDSGSSDIYPNPSLQIWTDTGISGGVIADYDNDGQKDLLVVKNLPAQRVIQAYKRSTDSAFVARNMLTNTSATALRNNFVPTIIVDNLDGDNIPDILCADTDGDVMVFEIVNANQHHLRWTKRLPVGNTYTLVSGDFDGNGRNDFFVGGYTTSILNPNLNFWYFEGFTRQADNNYTSMGSIMFNEVQSQNSIHATDLDNDGKAEIILAISPNLYVLRYENGAFIPTFCGESYRNYNIATWMDDLARLRIIANVRADADSSRAVEWIPQEHFTGPPTPPNLQVSPLDNQSAQISWIDTGAPVYRLYRKDENDVASYEDIVGVTSFTDVGLISGTPYRYAIAARDPAYSPMESQASNWVSVIPMPKPTVERIQMISSNEVRLEFSQDMPPDFVFPGYYYLIGQGNPLSANNLNNHRAVQLRFRNSFPAIDTLFTMEIRGLKGGTGVPMEQIAYTFPYVQDTEAPRIVEIMVHPSQQAVSIKYSEELSPGPASYLPNFSLTPPHIDSSNSIVSASLSTDTITINFSSTLKHSNVAYYIETNNLTDLAGNLISPQYKLARFTISEYQDLKDVTVFPNPVTPKHFPEAKFVHFPLDKPGQIAIYNSAGDLVFKSNIGPFTARNNNVTYTWNLKNNDGRPVSSGIYFYVVEMDGKLKRGKLAIIR